VSETNRDGRKASFAKAERLGAKAAQDPEFWQWAIMLSKRELIEIILGTASTGRARAIYRRLEKEGKI